MLIFLGFCFTTLYTKLTKTKNKKKKITDESQTNKKLVKFLTILENATESHRRNSYFNKEDWERGRNVLCFFHYSCKSKLVAASTLFPVVCKARMTRSRLKPILVKKVTFSSDGGVRSIGGGRTSVSKNNAQKKSGRMKNAGVNRKRNEMEFPLCILYRWDWRDWGNLYGAVGVRWHLARPTAFRDRQDARHSLAPCSVHAEEKKKRKNSRRYRSEIEDSKLIIHSPVEEVRPGIVGVTFDVQVSPFAPGVEFPTWHPLAHPRVAMKTITDQRSHLLFELTNWVWRASLESSTRSICTTVQQPMLQKDK